MAEPNLKDIVARCGLTKERLQKECSREIALKVATKLGDWKMVGHYLNIPSVKQKAIECKNDTEDQRKVALLETWRKGEGKGATCWKLANALYEHGRRDLVEFLCKATTSSCDETVPQNRETGRYVILTGPPRLSTTEQVVPLDCLRQHKWSPQTVCSCCIWSPVATCSPPLCCCTI